MPTIDRHDWSRKRMQFLQELLDNGPTDEQRVAIEAELNELRKSERGWLPRWLRFPRAPHQH